MPKKRSLKALRGLIKGRIRKALEGLIERGTRWVKDDAIGPDCTQRRGTYSHIHEKDNNTNLPLGLQRLLHCSAYP